MVKLTCTTKRHLTLLLLWLCTLKTRRQSTKRRRRSGRSLTTSEVQPSGLTGCLTSKTSRLTGKIRALIGSGAG